jgi:hypothetical protein
MKAVSQAISGMAASVRMLGSQIEALEKESAGFSSVSFGPDQASGINAALSGWAVAVRGLEQSNSELTSRLDEEISLRSTDARRHAVELDYVKSAAATGASELEALREETAALKSLDADKSAAIMKLEEEVRRLAEDLENARAEASEAGARASGLAKEISEKDAALEKSKADAAAGAAAGERQEKEIAALKQQLSGMHQQLTFEQTRAAAANDDAQRYMSEAKALKAGMESLRESAEKAARRLEEEAGHKTGLSSRIAELEGLVESGLARAAKAETEAAGANAALSQKEASAKALESEAASLRASMAEMASKVQAAAALVASFGTTFAQPAQARSPSAPPKAPQTRSDSPYRTQAAEGADPQARAAARELVAAFCRGREAGLSQALRNGTFTSIHGREVYEMQKAYASMSPKPGAYPEGVLKEEFDTALKSLLSAG